MSNSAEIDSSDSVEFAPSKRPRRWKRWVVAILVLLGIVLILAGIKAIQIKTMIDAGKAMVPPPESVSSAQVQQTQWAPVHSAVGTLVALRGVTLGSEVTGTVREIDFENGATVKKGDVLVRFDAASEEAQLASARADAVLAKQNLERAVRLRNSAVNTQSDLEAAQARDSQARAAVVNLQTAISKKVVRAPFDGRVGIRSVELGQVVAPGAPIVTLQTVTPILVEFQLPQQSLANMKVGQQVELKVDVFPKDSWKGTVTTINPEVDPNTRTVRIRATIPNEDGRLKPGMFANVDVLSAEQRQTLIIPATSVVYAPYGDSVYEIETAKDGPEKGKLIAHQQFVRLGDRRGDFVAVDSGLSAGQTIVSNGAFKLRNGQTVVVHNENVPTPELNPTPVER